MAFVFCFVLVKLMICRIYHLRTDIALVSLVAISLRKVVFQFPILISLIKIITILTVLIKYCLIDSKLVALPL